MMWVVLISKTDNELDLDNAANKMRIEAPTTHIGDGSNSRLVIRCRS